MLSDRTVTEMLKIISKEVKAGGIEKEYNFFPKGPYRVTTHTRGKKSETYFHTKSNCNPLNSLPIFTVASFMGGKHSTVAIKKNNEAVDVLLDTTDFLLCPITDCASKDLDATRISTLYQIATYSENVRKALSYKSNKPHVVKNRIETLKHHQKQAWSEYDDYSEAVSVKSSSYISEIAPEKVLKYYKDTLDNLDEETLKALKYLKTLLISDEMKERLHNKIKKELNGELNNTFFNENLVLVGSYNITNRIVLDEIHSIYAIKTEPTHTVSVMPQYVYDFYQRLIFKVSKELKWVGSIPLSENVKESIIETAASLWDPTSADGLSSLHEAYEVAKVI